MNAQWLDDSAYTQERGTGGRIPRPSGLVTNPDVQYARSLADDFAEAEALDGYVVDEMRIDWSGVWFCAGLLVGLAGWFWALDALIRWRLR